MDGVIRWVLHAQFGQAAEITLRWSERQEAGKRRIKEKTTGTGFLNNHPKPPPSPVVPTTQE